ncbi:MAG: sodium/proline symporter [Rickettsiales bacterium]|jgi:sodium/proline symporter
MIFSFISFLLLFVFIGILSTIKNKNTNKDYLLAGQNVKPWLVALSAVATNNSGYMFIGMIGYTYIYGFSSIWLMIGWVFGDFLSSLFVHKKLRNITKSHGVLSFAGVLSKWTGSDMRILRAYLGIITIIFLGTYAAAQLSAGSKALNVLLGWNYEVGAIIGALMVLLYCFAGGIRASIWTDAAQSFVMAAAMILLCVVATLEIGGFSNVFAKASLVSQEYGNILPSNLKYDSLPFGFITAPILFILGWIFAGIGVIGQPHIMVRFMTMDNANNMTKVRYYYYSFYLTFFMLTIFAGICARLLIPDAAQFDAELALPTLALNLLPEILVGIILAGLFAATMSTADSQILSCTAAITNDFSTKKPSYLLTKLSTVFVTFLALLIALYGSKSVFTLVLIAWVFLSASFAPLLIAYAFGAKPSQTLALLASISGILTIFVWKYFQLGSFIYVAAPAMIVGLLVLIVGLKLEKSRN